MFPIWLKEMAREQAKGLLPEPLLRLLAASQGGPATISASFEQLTGRPGRAFQ